MVWGLGLSEQSKIPKPQTRFAPQLSLPMPWLHPPPCRQIRNRHGPKALEIHLNPKTFNPKEPSKPKTYANLQPQNPEGFEVPKLLRTPKHPNTAARLVIRAMHVHPSVEGVESSHVASGSVPGFQRPKRYNPSCGCSSLQL